MTVAFYKVYLMSRSGRLIEALCDIKTMEKIEAFDNYAQEYDEWYESHRIEYEQELKAVRQLIPVDGKGIEIGAGTGRFTEPLGVSLGVEPSAAMREVASRRGVNIVDGEAEFLPADDSTYDYALFITTVCFLDSPEEAFREVFRILRPGGYIIVGFVDGKSNLGKIYEKKKNISKFYKGATFHTVKEMRDELEKVGFCNVAYIQATLPGDVSEGEDLVVKKGYGEGSFVVIRAQKNVVLQ